ncbi:MULTISPECIES: hypothetical protein [unclassified Ensifer]|uniref:hypothetical protein n=1 Tax=unclassified Ensifer TaxID=2633371 RepID=UPI0013966793|nr:MULTISPECIES: hypothetical protein [unclassified Ensifer]
MILSTRFVLSFIAPRLSADIVYGHALYHGAPALGNCAPGGQPAAFLLFKRIGRGRGAAIPLADDEDPPYLAGHAS